MKHKSDLTTGGIFQKMIFVAMPLMATQLSQMLYNLLDMFWLGRLSSEAVAATGAAGMYIWLSMAMLLIGRMGAEIGVAQNKGRGNMLLASAFARNALLLSLVLGIVYGSALMFFADPLLSVFDIREADMKSMAVSYLSIIGLGIPASYMTASIAGSFNGSGNPTIPLLTNVSGLVLSVFLKPWMIFGLDLGIHGAAASTVLAQWLVFALLLLAVKKHKTRPFEHIKYFTRPNKEVISSIVKWALPVSIESAFFSLLTMTVTRLIIGFGSDAMAVYRIGGQIEQLSWLIGSGFGTAMTAFVGQNFGAGKWDRIYKGFRVSSIAMFFWGGVVMILMIFGGYVLYSLFLREHELRTMGAVYLGILATCQIPGCMEHVGAGLFRGLGRTFAPSAISISSNVLRVIACYLLASTALGLHGVWWGLTLTAVLRGTVIFGCALVVLLRSRREKARN